MDDCKKLPGEFFEDLNVEQDGQHQVPSKKGRVEKSPSLEEPVQTSENILQMIRVAQKEALWKHLQEARIQSARWEEKFKEAFTELKITKEGLLKATTIWSKLLFTTGVEDSSHEPSNISSLIKSVVGRLQSLAPNSEASGFLERLERIGELEAIVQVLEEERTRERHLLAEKEEQLLQLERKNRRLEIDSAKLRTPISSQNQPALPASTEVNKPEPAVDSRVISELEALRTLAAQRLAELDKVERGRAEIRFQNVQLQEKLRRIPEDILKDPRGLKELRDELKYLRQELERQRKSMHILKQELEDSNERKEKILADLEVRLGEKQYGLKKFLDGVETEATRMRRERDHMRELYEQANSQVSASNRQNANLQLIMTRIEEKDRQSEAQALRSSKLVELLQKISVEPLDQRLVDFSNLVTKLREDEMLLYSELEVIGKAFEDLKSQNLALLKQISDKDETNSKLLAEKLKAEFALVQAKKDSELSLQKSGALERTSLERLELAEAREKQARIQIMDSETRLCQRMFDYEKIRSQLLEVTEENNILQARIERLAALNSEQIIAEKTRALDATIYEKQRLLEQIEVLQKRLFNYLDSTRGGPQKELEEELSIYKKLMKCNSCHIRDKNAVITRCMHVFCRQCLDVRIETRQRKCPNCGEPFGISDVRSIYL